MGGIMSIILQGSTSGSITLQEPAVAGTTVLTLPATSGTILTTGSSGQSIPKAALPTGSVLQVAQFTATASTTIAADSGFFDTSLTGTFTPLFSTSKVLITINQQNRAAASNPSNLGCRLALLRNGTIINYFSASGSAADAFEITADNGGNVRLAGYISVSYLDSPATTSALTYKTQAYANAGSNVFQNNSSPSYITFMEIAA